jgi:hypothetical protein
MAAASWLSLKIPVIERQDARACDFLLVAHTITRTREWERRLDTRSPFGQSSVVTRIECEGTAITRGGAFGGSELQERRLSGRLALATDGTADPPRACQ